MTRRYPEAWLMTDERTGTPALLRALRRMPPRSGVVFRHYATPPAERRALFRAVCRIARARRMTLLVGRGDGLAGDGAHGVQRRRAPTSAPAHDRRQAIAASEAGARLLFVSPVFATHSHPDRRPIGPMRAAAIGRGLDAAIVALGGMDARRFRRIARLGFDGWAAIDAWTGQKRKAVPT